MNLNFPRLEESKQSHQPESTPLHWQYPEKISLTLPKNAHITPQQGEIIFSGSKVNVLTGKTVVGDPVPEDPDLQTLVLTAQKAMQACFGISSLNFFSREDGLSSVEMAQFSSLEKAQTLWHSVKERYNQMKGKVSFSNCKTMDNFKAGAEIIKESKAGNCRHLCIVAAAAIHGIDPKRNIEIVESGNHVYMILDKKVILDPWTRAIMPKDYRPSHLLGDVIIAPNQIQDSPNTLFYPIVIDKANRNVKVVFEYHAQT